MGVGSSGEVERLSVQQVQEEERVLSRSSSRTCLNLKSYRFGALTSQGSGSYKNSMTGLNLDSPVT